MYALNEKIIWQYWETRGDKPRFIEGLYRIAQANSGVKIICVTPETLGRYLPDIEGDIFSIADMSHKADMIRTRLVLRHGGMWLDSDAIVLRDLNWLFALLNDHEFVGFNDGGQLHSERPFVRVSCFLSRPNGKIIREWVGLQKAKFPKTIFGWSEIGASMLNPICLENRQLVKVLPFEQICPLAWDEVDAFASQDEKRAESILRECFIVMLTNRSLEARQPQLKHLTVEEIAAGDTLLGNILHGAIMASRQNIFLPH